METNAAALEDQEATLAEIEEILGVCSEDLANVRKKVEQAQSVADAAKDDLAEMKAELDERMALLNQFRAKEVRVLLWPVALNSD